ncbi:MAG: serine/threonine protein kinase [Myxococcales bacterium]|nr:serine/threonine protein kinase [Myxococcales bacterium]
MDHVSIGGRYRFLRRLAQGGSGTVWSAQDDLGIFDKCAIKFPYCDPIDQSIRDRYQREACFLALLGESPHIVRPYACGESNGVPYLVMELLGMSLRELIDLYRYDRTPLSLDFISDIITQICSALVIAHRNLWPGAILHLDINPNNVLLQSTAGARPVVKIVDFSSARVARQRHLLALPTEGTPGYMAPEQERGDREALCPATDVYAIGVLALELLLLERGQVAWLQNSLVGTGVQDDHTPWESPLLIARRPDVPIALWHVVRQATRASATERFGDAGALADAWTAAMTQASHIAAAAAEPVHLLPALDPATRTQPLPCPATEILTQRVPSPVARPIAGLASLLASAPHRPSREPLSPEAVLQERLIAPPQR